MKRHKFIKATAQDVKKGDIIRYKDLRITWNVAIDSLQETEGGFFIFGTLLPNYSRVEGDNGKWTKEFFEGRESFKGYLRWNKKLEIAID